MFENSKAIFITHPYYAVNNPSNNFKIYKKNKNSDYWTIIHCKNKEDYRKKIKEYITGFFDYGRDEEKANISVSDYINEKNSSSMFDYFLGSKKTDDVMLKNKMKREEMAMLKNGKYLLDKDVYSMQKRWSNYIEESNIQLTVLSFYQDYIDSNINIKELQKKITTEVMPKFFSYCGYENPRENLEWVVALHSDRDNNYHFHISWVEKNKCYRNSNNKLDHRIKLKLSEKEINFLKRQTTLTIERNALYKPALIELNENFENLQSYFNPKDHNFTLKNIKDLELEEKIIKLGLLISQVRATNRKYIKYNSLPKNEIGSEIKKLTQDIKRKIFKQQELKEAKTKVYKSIDKINEILIDIDKRNSISTIGFEKAIDNKMIQGKLSKSDTYILNAIANHALYNFSQNKSKTNNDSFKLEDIIDEIAYKNYMDNYYSIRKNKVVVYKIKLLKNFLEGHTSKSKVIKALERLSREQDKAANKFYEMLDENLKEI